MKPPCRWCEHSPDQQKSVACDAPCHSLEEYIRSLGRPKRGRRVNDVETRIKHNRKRYGNHP